MTIYDKASESSMDQTLAVRPHEQKKETQTKKNLCNLQ